MATVYISTTGNDTTGNGTIGTPWATLTKAKTGTTTGDTIVLLAGTYDATTIGAMNSSRIFRGSTSNPYDTIIDGDEDVRYDIGIPSGTGTRDYEVRNLTFQNFKKLTPTSNFPVFCCGTGSLTAYGLIENVVFRDCSVADSGASPTGLIGSGQISSPLMNLTLRKVLFYDIVKSSDGTATEGILIGKHGNGSSEIVTIENCTAYFEGTSTAAMTSFVRISGNPSNPERTFDITMTNSIIHNNQSTAMVFFNQGANIVVTHAITFCNVFAEGSASWTSTTTLGAGCIQQNPSFVSPQDPNRDFRLSADSPSRWTGIKL
jgi:hypothetical protein